MTGALLKEGAKAVAADKATSAVSGGGKPSPSGVAGGSTAATAKRDTGGGKGNGSLLSGVKKVAPSPGKVKTKFRPGQSLGGNKVIVAEFIACMVLVGLAPIVGTTTSAGAWLKKGAAVTGLFLVLSLVASGGPRSSKIAAAFGGLCTLALLINSHEIFAAIIGLLGGGGGDLGEEDIGAGGEAVAE
jgi:hypothetical protein